MTDPAAEPAPDSDAFRAFTDTELEAARDQAWFDRNELSERLLHISGELLVRALRRHVPQLARVLLREDTSHGAPHGHLHQVLDQDGNILVDGSSDAWHDAEWSIDIDDYAWEIHHLGRHLFRTRDDAGRFYEISVPQSP